MTFEKIKQYPAQISNIFKRFPLPVSLGVFSALYAIFLVHWGDESNFISEHPRLYIWIATFSLLSIFLSSATKLLQEAKNYPPKKSWIITGASETVLGILTAGYIATGSPENEHFIAKMVVLVAVVVLSPLMVPFFKGKNDIPLWNFIGKAVKSFLISTVITLLFYGALAGLAGGIYLLTKFDIFNGEYFLDTGAICLCIVFPSLFFAGLPNLSEPNENGDTSRYFNNTIHFLFIPVLLLYILFVYAYAIKIGLGYPHDLLDLSAMAFAAIISTILISGIIYPSHFKNNFDKKFLRIVPWTAIPLTLLSVGKFIHHLDGATPGDAYILLYIIITHIWFITALIILLVPRIKKKIWWTLASLTIVAIVSTFSPINVFKISAHTYLTSEKYLEKIRERSELEARRQEEEAKRRAKTRYLDFDSDRKSPVTIPTNRHTVVMLENTYLKYNQLSLAGDSILMQVKSNNFNEDSTFINFAVAISQLTDSTANEKPLHLILDNGSETLVLYSASFKFVEDDDEENYGSIKGYIFK